MPADPAQSPILVMAFNRPDYLATTLESLMRQQGVDIGARRIFLFQDGGRNLASGRVACGDDVIRANIDIFCRIVPHGIPLPTYHNLGIAMNFDRAERFAFEELAADAAVFLEDDLELGPFYLATLDRLIGMALADERIGYVAAYGDPRAPLAAQRASPARLIPMGHNWAFGLTRRQWLKQRPYVEQYLAIVRGQDYGRRDHDRIIDLFHSWGLGAPGSSQDIAKSHACILTGTAKVSTYGCYGRYIGRQGVHFNDAIFEKLGFAGTQIIEEDLFAPFAVPQAQLLDFVERARVAALTNNIRHKDGRDDAAAEQAMSALERLTALFQQGRFDEAEPLCVEWLARAPALRDRYGHPAFLKELTRLTLARGRIAEAKQLGARLAQLIPPLDPCVNLLFGRAYIRLGDRDAALAEWRAAMEKDPDAAEARQGLIRLGALPAPDSEPAAARA
jgi:tetratricopeptide (TPR) repeat protein